ncbi:hypothetical protein MJO29_009309 [Puccinia striiformis f. sp. tritici]|nr:hypothetical protein MJO29_009309 [Puccinia striiformis f. sp. tritici]
MTVYFVKFERPLDVSKPNIESSKFLQELIRRRTASTGHSALPKATRRIYCSSPGFDVFAFLRVIIAQLISPSLAMPQKATIDRSSIAKSSSDPSEKESAIANR